jgi:hypothetical protein
LITAKNSSKKLIKGTAAMVSPNLIITSKEMVSKDYTDFKFYPAADGIVEADGGI